MSAPAVGVAPIVRASLSMFSRRLIYRHAAPRACGGAVPARHRFMALTAGFRNCINSLSCNYGIVLKIPFYTPVPNGERRCINFLLYMEKNLYRHKDTN